MITAFLLVLAGISGGTGAWEQGFPPTESQATVALVLHTYEARIRLEGRVSTTRVQAHDAGQARKLVQAQYGGKVTVLSVKRVDGSR